MQIGSASHHVRGPVQRGDEVPQVLAVRADLSHRVEDGPAPVGRLEDELGVVLEQLGVRPLLQLEDDVRRAVPPGMLSGQDNVDALAAEGKLVLQQRLDVLQPGLKQVGCQDAQARVPGAHLRGGGATLHLERHLLGEDSAQAAGRRQVGQTSRGGAQ
jgi:hypothetical protein